MQNTKPYATFRKHSRLNWPLTESITIAVEIPTHSGKYGLSNGDRIHSCILKTESLLPLCTCIVLEAENPEYNFAFLDISSKHLHLYKLCFPHVAMA